LGVDAKILDVLRPALRPSHDIFQVASKLFADAAVWHPQRLARPLGLVVSGLPPRHAGFRPLRAKRFEGFGSVPLVANVFRIYADS